MLATAGKDGMLRGIDRDSRSVVFETPVTTRENAEVPVGLTPLRACPGVLGGVQWNGPAYSPRTRLLYVPAVDWCTTFAAFEQVRHIPGKLYMLGRKKEACELLERLLSLGNDLGLLSEEYDPREKRLLGNFPQAFTHVALITTVHFLEGE